MFPIPIISNTSIYTPPIDEYARFVQEMAMSDRTYIPFDASGNTAINQGARLCIAQFNNSITPANLGAMGSAWGWQLSYTLGGASYTLNQNQIVGLFKQIFPNEEIFDENRTNNRIFGWTRLYGSGRGYVQPALTRNSIVTGTGTYAGSIFRYGIGITDLIYYDFNTQKMMTYKPEVGTRGPNIPVPYYNDESSVPSDYTPTEYDTFFKQYCPKFNYINSTKSTTLASMSIISQLLTYGNGTYYVPCLQYVPTITGTYGAILSGSSWGQYLITSAPRHIHRAVQHAFPNVDIYNSYLANGYGCAIDVELVDVTDVPITGIARNGYTSNSLANFTGTAVKITKLRYYDASTGKMMQINPFEMGTPTELY